jgi:hypothetical protein
MSDTNNETQEIINDLKAKANIPIKGKHSGLPREVYAEANRRWKAERR